jgi:tripeptidyl-peptidase-1
MLRSLVLAYLAMAGLAVAAASGGVKKTSGQVPSSWKLKGASSGTSSFNFTLHLVGQNMAGLSTRMKQIVADGKGAWLADADLAQYVSPTAAATKAVITFLKSSGFPASAITANKNGDQVTVKTTVAMTSKVFSATMNDYNADGPTISRALSYIIPASISAYVEDVSPLALFGSIQGSGYLADEQRSLPVERHPSVHQIRDNIVPASCNVSSVTPQCRKDYYGTASYKRSTGTTVPDVAVIGFNNQYISNALMSAFLKKYAKNVPSDYIMPVSAYNGAPKTMEKAGFEAMLNAEAVVAEIYPLTTNYITMATINNREDPWLLAFNTLIEKFTSATRPKVVSISYSGGEKYFSASQGKIMCDAAQKLTALGTTIVVSTGDFGVGGDDGEACPAFNPRYPIGCPYVLAVGATEGFAPEQPMEPNDGGLGLLSSGAGTSNIFGIPAYQAKQVAAYQKTIGTSMNGYYNTTGRMYPDLTALGSRYSIIFNGRDQAGSGTSASTPYVAALYGLINDKRKAAKKGPVGWANPSLYGASLKDVTVGGSYGCSETKYGFPSKSGYDAASGNGSPMFAALSTAYGV